MEKQLLVSESLGLSATGMPISSDVLESLYGLGKTHGTGEVKDANRIALRLPAYCGDLSNDAAEMVMGVSVQQQQEIEKPLLSLIRQRRSILPNPGSITELLNTDGDSYLSLLPVPKSGEKIDNIIDITGSYGSKIGPRCLELKDLNETYRFDFDEAS